MLFTSLDHDVFLKACSDPRAKQDEVEFLSYCAALAAAREHVDHTTWLRAQALVGGALDTITPIFDR
jgi:hypothetical protein